MPFLSQSPRHPGFFSLLSNLLVLGCLLGAAASGVSAAEPREAQPDAQVLRLGKIPVNRILYLGNSITFHPAAEKDGHPGEWGMAASSADKDYVHLLTARIGAAAGGAPQFLALNIADFERGYPTYDLANGLRKAWDFHPDLVVVAIGENVPPLTTDEMKRAYADGFRQLLAQIKEQGNPMIVVRSMFWAGPDRDEVMRTVSHEAGVLFVDLQNPSADPRNAASAERTISHPGVGGHPGDKGMQAIADALWTAISAASGAKEPSPAN